MLEFNTVRVLKVESKKSTKKPQKRSLIQTKVKCTFATCREIFNHTFSRYKLQSPYVKLHIHVPVKSKTYMHIFEVEKETAAKENVAFDCLKQ